MSSYEYYDDMAVRIREKNELFDLYDFYIFDTDKYFMDSGAGIITPKQMIFYFSSIGHMEIFKRIYGVIYEDFDSILMSEHYNWVQSVLSLNGIILRILPQGYVTIWIPLKINSYQYQRLVAFNEVMKDINHYLESIDRSPIKLKTNLPADKNRTLSLEEALDSIKDRVVDDNFREENIIVNSADEKKLVKRLDII